MASPKKEWLVNLNQGVITEEMLSMALYSANKRAKNCRDKIREYNHLWYFNSTIGKGITQYRDTMEKYYAMKRTMLSVLKPCKVHEETHPDGSVEHFLYYKTAFGSYHLPIEQEEIANVTFLTRGGGNGGKYQPPIQKVVLVTVGADINDLVSMQFVTKVCELIKSGNFIYVPFSYNKIA